VRWAVLLVASLMAIAARPAAGLEKLRIAYPSVSVTLTPLWIAKDLGFFRAEGLEVETTFISGATPTVQALLAGDIQAGVGVGAPPVVTAILQGGDLTIAAVPGNRLDNVLVSRTPVRTPAELAGKRFGISARGAPAEVVTRIALQRLGVDPDRVVMVAVGGGPQRRAAMSAGLIDATVLSSAEFVQEQGQVHLVLDLAKAGLDFPYQTLVVTKQFATQNRPLVLGMIRALVKALRFMRANREESVRIAAQWTKTADLDRIQRQWQHIAFDLWQEIPRPSESGFRLVVETLGDRHPRLATLRLSDVFDASFVEELERSGFFANR
jgi:NitT/TauT family transport system substrate-binding protein